MGRWAHAQPHTDNCRGTRVTFTTSPALRTRAPAAPFSAWHLYVPHQHKPRPPALECNRQVFLQVKSWLRLPRGTTSVRYQYPGTSFFPLAAPQALGSGGSGWAASWPVQVRSYVIIMSSAGSPCDYPILPCPCPAHNSCPFREAS